MATNTTNAIAAKEKCDVSQLKAGDWLTCHEKYKVVSIGNGSVSLKTPSGSHSSVASGIVENEFHSASNANREEYVTKTRLRSLLQDATGMFTVCYEKSMKTAGGINYLNDILKTALENNSLNSDKERKKFLREKFHGEEREMTCCHMRDPDTNERLKPEHGGLLPVWDSNKNAKRTVDPRSVKWLVWQEVKYIEGRKPKSTTSKKRKLA